jgi:hypothetical protein
VRAIWRRLMSPRILTTAAVLYTTLVVLWLLLVSYGVRLEHPADTRFVNISDWPTKPTLVGLAWTVLLLVGGAAAVRAERGLGAWCLGAMTACALTLWFFIPVWFRGMGVTGLSTSEFTDAFLIVGGILPGGQGTLVLRSICIAFASLTAFRALLR